MNQVFKDHPNLQKYYQTADGTKFFQEDNAKLHSRSCEDKRVETIVRGTSGKVEKAVEAPAGKVKSKAAKLESKDKGKTEDSGTVDSKDLNPMQAAKLRKEAIEKIETIAEVQKALEGETAQSVIKAGNERIAALKASEALNSNKENPNVQTQ